jgi:hypothetical protein
MTVEATNGSHDDGSLVIVRNDSDQRDALLLSDAVAERVGELFAATEDAARAIREKARDDARSLVRTATHEAAGQARLAVATVARESVPALEARVAELRELVEAVRGDIERLTEDLGRLAGGTPPAALPPGTGAAPEPVRTPAERQALLIALNMASNGASREEASRYLVEHLTIQDHETLLNAVYGYVGAERDGPSHDGQVPALPEENGTA